MSDKEKDNKMTKEKKECCSGDKFKRVMTGIKDQAQKSKKRFDEYEPDEKRTIITVVAGAITLFLALFGLKRHIKTNSDKKEEKE